MEEEEEEEEEDDDDDEEHEELQGKDKFVLKNLKRIGVRDGIFTRLPR